MITQVTYDEVTLAKPRMIKPDVNVFQVSEQPWGGQVEIWPLRIQEPIPVLPVPLREPDPDVPLDLGKAIQTIYDAAGYDLRIDYRELPPKPDLAPEDATWVEAQLQAVR